MCQVLAAPFLYYSVFADDSLQSVLHCGGANNNWAVGFKPVAYNPYSSLSPQKWYASLDRHCRQVAGAAPE